MFKTVYDYGNIQFPLNLAPRPFISEFIISMFNTKWEALTVGITVRQVIAGRDSCQRWKINESVLRFVNKYVWSD